MSQDLKWIEVFKGGRRTSSNNITRDYTADELQQVAETYNPQHFKAPLIVSYPAHNTAGHSDGELHKSQLAFGFPEKLKVAGDRLLAGFNKISPKVKEWINNGEILGFSSSFYLPDSPFNPYPGKLALRHIAGCGIDPPAVKGMAPPELSEPLSAFPSYAEDQEGSVEFSLLDTDDPQELADARLGQQIYRAMKAIDRSTASFMGEAMYAPAPNYLLSEFTNLMRDWYQRMRDQTIDDKSLEDADKLYPSYIADSFNRIAGQFSSQSLAPAVTWDDMARLERRLDQLSATVAGESPPPYFQEEPMTDNENAQYSELKTENEKLREQVQTIQAEREKERITSFVEGLVRDRKVIPSNKDKEIRFILTLPNGEIADYGEDGELTPRQAYMNKLTGQKELWSDRRLPTGPEDAPPNYSDTANYGEGFDPDSIKLDRQIRAKCQAMGKDPGITEYYEAAWDELIREGAASKSFAK